MAIDQWCLSSIYFGTTNARRREAPLRKGFFTVSLVRTDEMGRWSTQRS